MAAATPMETNAAQPDSPLLDYPPNLSCILSCVFCQSDLTDSSEKIEKAKLLVCFHSVCHTCVASWKSGDITELKVCPICEQVNKLEDLVDNKLIQELVEEPESNPNGMCKMHEDLPVQMYCIECKLAVCTTCIHSHSQLFSTKNHSIVELSQMPPETNSSVVNFNCPNHPAEMMTMYCLDCQTMTCRDCILNGPHQTKLGHRYENLAKVCEEEKKSVYKREMELERRRQQWKASEDVIRKKINASRQQQVALEEGLDNCRKRVIEIIESKFNELKKKLATYIDEDVQKMSTMIAENAALAKSMNHVSEVMCILLKNVSDLNFMYCRRHLTKCMEQLVPEPLTFRLPDSTVKRTYSIDKLKELIKELRNFTAKLGDVVSVLEDAGDRGESAVSIASPSGQTAAVPPAASPPVRLRPTGDLQSPEPRAPSTRSSREMMPPALEAAALPSGVISWHTPQQPPAKPSASRPLPTSLPSDTTISAVRGPPVTSPVTPIVSQFSAATISPGTVQAPSHPAAQIVARRTSGQAGQSRLPLASLAAIGQHSRQQQQLQPQQQQLMPPTQQQQQPQQQQQQLSTTPTQQQQQQMEELSLEALLQQGVTSQSVAQPQMVVMQRTLQQNIMVGNLHPQTGTHMRLSAGGFPSGNQQPHQTTPPSYTSFFQNNPHVSLLPSSSRQYQALPGQHQPPQQQQQPSLQVLNRCLLCNEDISGPLTFHLFYCPRLAHVRSRFPSTEHRDSLLAYLSIEFKNMIAGQSFFSQGHEQ